MDVSTILQMVQVILQLLGSSVMKEIESVWSFASVLAKIKETMSTIKAVLLDAERQERQLVQFSEADCDWLEKLRDVVYQIDDLFDEVTTVAQLENLSGKNVAQKVLLFISHPGFVSKVSREVKHIKERLDDIAKNRRNFGSSSGPYVGEVGGVVRRRREGSYSFVRDENIVGRDEDKKAVIDMLLDSGVKENVSFITVVGMGGLGKTTLAQLVYKDERIEREFSPKLWVCVSDDFNLKSILRGILESANKQKPDDVRMDLLQDMLRQAINGKKYLLVLDDLWNEDRHKWLDLRDLLIGGGNGSRVVVTTRSETVGKVVGRGLIYRLKGLSDEDSWCLFKRMAFEEGLEQRDPELLEIGKDIVKKCACLPLALRVVGSFLYGKGKSMWLSFKNNELAAVIQDNNENPIFPMLKLSYYYLESPLKNCFKYCAIFPKDNKMDKEALISMWIAQGFIGASSGQSLEDVGENYFMALLERCFFQDVKLDTDGEITSCKLHDLMHDVAQEVAGSEIAVVDSTRSHCDEQVRHLRICNAEVKNSVIELATKKRLRTYVSRHGQSHITNVILSTHNCLRVLDLSRSKIKQLPSRVEDKLLHLRYLDLSWNMKLKVLPRQITELRNLQTLKLGYCSELEELPRGTSKLVNLRHLDIGGCEKLTHMPPRMNILTCLQALPLFIVGAGASSRACAAGSLMKKDVGVGQLEELRALTGLRGYLFINVQEDSRTNGAKVKEAQCLSHMEHLKGMAIQWGSGEGEVRGDDDNVEALLEGLQPHHNLKKYGIISYPGMRFPSWGILKNLCGTPPSKLVEISVVSCTRLQHLPSLSQLRFLKSLELSSLGELEYVECSADISSSDDNGGAYAGTAVGVWSSQATNPTLFFPSLETLVLRWLPKLKGWWKASSSSVGGVGGSFPRLSSLVISYCPNLRCVPLCPNLEILELVNICEGLLLGPIMMIDCKSGAGSDEPSSSSLGSPLSSLALQRQFFSLKRVKIDDVGYLKSLPVESFQRLSSLTIQSFDQERWSTMEADLSSLRFLEISECQKLRSLTVCRGGGWEHLTALETLSLSYLKELDLHYNLNTTTNHNDDDASDDDRGRVELVDDDDGGYPWRCLSHTLRSLNLFLLLKLVKLPKGMQHLTSLHSLHIQCCQNLEALPEWLASLTSLQSFTVSACSERLKQRCQQPYGEDWPHIRHIPHLSID